MANPSFAELKERFNKMNVLPYPKPRSSSIDNGTSTDSTGPDKLKNDDAKQFCSTSSLRLKVFLYGFFLLHLDNAHPRSLTPNPLSQASKETASLLEAKLVQSRPNPTNVAPPKKVPIPLPRPVIPQQTEKTSTEISSIPQPSIVSQVVQVPVLSIPDSEWDENTYMEVTSDFSDPSYSSDISELSTSRSGDQSCISLPVPVIPNRSKTSHIDSASTSLDTLLPPKCMFFQFENVINSYQRREARTIICPKVKPSMGKLTSDEINTLQRYSNT